MSADTYIASDNGDDMNILALLVASASLLTGGTCAAHDNAANTAAWTSPNGVTTTAYADLGRLQYEDAPAPDDDAGWMALHASERALQDGEPGFKITLICHR